MHLLQENLYSQRFLVYEDGTILSLEEGELENLFAINAEALFGDYLEIPEF